jgi:hypothetical protein
MLYIGFIMNAQPNLPEDIGFGKMNLWGSCRGSMKAGAGWMFTVYLTDIPGEWLIRHHPEWPFLLRSVIALLPLAAGLLYVRGIAKWIRGMDELDQRVTLGAFLFGVTAYLFLSAGWALLIRGDVFTALNLTRLHLERVPFNDCTFAVCLTYLFAGLGYSICNRRYK